jgi:hypothetical protein
MAAEKSDPEHTYKFFPNENPWTWEQQSTAEEVKDADNLLQRASVQEGRTRRTEGAEHHNEQQESGKSHER